MHKYNARDLLNRGNSCLYEDLPDSFEIEFEDNVTITSSKKKLIYSNYFWRFHREYQNLPILSTHHVSNVIKDKALTSKTHAILLTIIGKDVVKYYGFELPKDINKIALLDQQITNQIFNEVTQLAEDSITTIDILDFIEINDYPPVKSLVDNTKPNKESISNTYTKVRSILLTDPEIKDNNLVKAVRSSMVNINQVLQCVTIRGFLTELDGAILPNPVMTNFVEGLGTLYDFLAESRSAARSLFFNDTKISDTEFFARRLQLLSMVVECIDYNDCGSTEYLNWRVNPPNKDIAKGINYPGDLTFMFGKLYLDEETGELKEITKDDPSLYNKVIKLRSPLYCKAPNPHQICKTCFGRMSLNVGEKSILGHQAPATTTNQSTGAVLATKHLSMSSTGQTIILSKEAQRVFKINKEENLFILQPYLKDKKVRIMLNREEVNGLADVFTYDNIDKINLNRISSITGVAVVYTEKATDINVVIDLVETNKKPIMTLEFLKHISFHKWTTDIKGNFVFDMSSWNFDNPVFKLPEIEYNFSDHSSQMAEKIESSMKKIDERSRPDSPDSTVQDLFMLVNSKLDVNLACLEVIIYASMIDDVDKQGLNRHSKSRALGVSRSLIAGRSLSNAYAFQEQDTFLVNSESFIKGNRPDSVLDVNIDPKNVIKALRDGKRVR